MIGNTLCRLGIHDRAEEHFLEPRPGPAPRPTVHQVCQRCRDGDPFVDAGIKTEGDA